MFKKQMLVVSNSLSAMLVPFFQGCLFELPYGRSFLPELRRNLSLF